jgi:tetratricopeptide (TPR) repeat protein
MRLVGCVVVLVVLEASCGRSAQSYLERGNALFRLGKYADAQLEYRGSIAKNPRLAEAYYRLGLAEIQLDHGPAALAALERAVDFAPNDDQYGIELADLSLEAYQADPRATRAYDQTTQIAYDLLKKNPNSFDGLRLRGEVLVIDRKYEEALPELRKAEAVRPLDPSVNVPMARALFALNRTQEAEKLAGRVLASHRDSGAMYDLLVSYYLKTHRTADAEHLLQSEAAALPKDVSPRLELASLYRESGRRSEMAATLEGIRKDRALFPDAPGIVGDFYAGNGEWEEALREYQDGERSASKDKAAYEKGVARALAALGQPNKAINELNAVLKVHPEDSDARMTRAILLRESPAAADQDLAITELKDLSSQFPTDAVTRYNLGLAYVVKGDVKTGAAELKKAAGLEAGYPAPRMALAELAEKSGDHADTVRYAEQILAADPGNRDAILMHAAGLIGIKNYSRARAELTSLLTSQADSPDVNLRLAVLDTAEHEFAAAEARYRKLYQPGSDDARPLEGLVQLYLTEKQPAKADVLLAQELRRAPNSRGVHLLAASTALEEGKHGLAIQQYEWLRANGSTSVDVLKSLGDLYRDQGDTERAIAAYEKASELAPGDEDILNNLAVLQNDAGQMQAAMATLKKELALDPGDAASMNNLAFDLAETGASLDQALTLAEAAARKLPDDPGVIDTLGWVYVKKGLNGSAIQVFRRLVNKNPDHPVYRYHLGVAYLQDHHPNEAKSEFSIALSQKPPKELAQKLQALSARL